jgi:glycosyltransferase involved in cell wall biosynthesis
MATILKKPTQKAKGIIVFTHKELNYFKGRPSKPKGLKVFNPKFYFDQLLKIALSPVYKQKLNKVHKKYYVGIHWGWYARDVRTPNWVDFHLAGKETATFADNPFIIPLGSSNFTPVVMQPTGEKKYWDIICVAKATKIKKYDELLKSIKRIFEEGHQYRVLFVIASNKDEPKSSYYSEILDDYNKLFTAQERERFTIIKTDPNTGFQGFSYSFIAHLYNQSKIFTLFTQREGVAKVIKEAQLCGLPVVVKSDLEGGGRDYLNGKNSHTFDTYEASHKALIHAVENYESFDVENEELVKEIRADHSLENLKKHLKELFSKHNQVFDGELINTDNLNRRFPAHYYDETVFWSRGKEYRYNTTDITSYGQFSRLFKKII